MSVVLDLCGGTGAWSEPWKATHEVISVTLPEQDVRLYQPPKDVNVVLAAPPCDHFAGSGARWWAGKGEVKLLEGLAVVDACLRIIAVTKPRVWCLENPVGRLRRWLGAPQASFNPCDYGDPYTKRTCLWGDFVMPEKSPVKPTDQRIWRMPPSPDRKEKRSITPPGFAKAFYEANQKTAAARPRR